MSLSAVRLLGRSVIALLAFAMLTGTASAQLVEGKNYIRLPNPQPVETGNKIEVVEFFSYGCPHCAALEPYLDKWLESLPQDVAFRRVPVMFHPDWLQLAKVYYTLDAMGQAAKLSSEVFKAIHQQNVNLADKNKFFDWAAGKGLDRKKVEEVFSSFAIDGKVKRAMQLAQEYHIEGVPTRSDDVMNLPSTMTVGTPSM
jgi:thiol:disulfide interchange protein DsbA